MKNRMYFKIFLAGVVFVLFSCFRCEPDFVTFLKIKNTSYEQVYFMGYKYGEPKCMTIKQGEQIEYWEESWSKSFLSILAPYDSCVVKRDCAHGEVLKVWRKNYDVNSLEQEFFREDDWELHKGKDTWVYIFDISDINLGLMEN